MVRSILLGPLFLLFHPVMVSAQECYPFDNIPEGAPTLNELEKRYADKDTSGEVNPKKPYMPDIEGVGQKYRDFVADLGTYLDSNGFKWDTRIRYFQRIYFGKDAKADYYLYEFKYNAPKGERRDLFEKLVEEYLSKNGLGISAKGRFAMCAPVVLKPDKEDGE